MSGGTRRFGSHLVSANGHIRLLPHGKARPKKGPEKDPAPVPTAVGIYKEGVDESGVRYASYTGQLGWPPYFLVWKRVSFYRRPNGSVEQSVQSAILGRPRVVRSIR